MKSNFQTPWPNLKLYARDCGEIDPYNDANADLFRGEEAFAPDVAGWKRWSKPSPEPQLDAEFEPILLDSIAHQAPQINAMARALSAKIIANNPDKPPVLLAILRAGAPICALLSPILSEHYGETIPICAFSLFYGLGWDEVALAQILAEHPNHRPIFVDGWTSGGGVATQIALSFDEWKTSGKPDFTDGRGPQFAVLCDPRGIATHSAIRADFWVPSAAFTAPETLGFSRGFAFEDGGLFGVYRFPVPQLKRNWIESWLNVLNVPPTSLPLDDAATAPDTQKAPDGFRVHVNEVTRALINRAPLEIWLRPDETEARQTLAPLLYHAAKRGVPIRFGREELANWGALAVARMK